MMFCASTLVCLLWCVRGARRFCDGPFMRLVRHVSGKSARVRRLPSRGTHIVVSPIVPPSARHAPLTGAAWSRNRDAEATVQRLALLPSKVHNRTFLTFLVLEERQKFALLGFGNPQTLLPQHLLGDAPTGPAGDGRRKIDVAPFWMALGFQKLVPLGEKSLGKPSHTPIAIGIFRPVENREHRRHCNSVDPLPNSVDPLPLRNQRRIFLSGELAERVHVGKGLRKGNGH